MGDEGQRRRDARAPHAGVAAAAHGRPAGGGAVGVARPDAAARSEICERTGRDDITVGVERLAKASSTGACAWWRRSLTGLAVEIGADRSVREGCRRVLRAEQILRSWRAASIAC